MTSNKPAEFSDQYDHVAVETSIREGWEAAKLYDFDPVSTKPVFSIDTPPPYVSAAHLHVGHAMSYAQAEFIVRYRRMRGYEIFYPMGFDDNGLPTERFVEKAYGVNKNNITRARFRELCLEETTKGAKVYETMWRALGLSVDWRLRYSTIDPHCCKTAQLSFLDLYGKGLVYRSDEPVLWDTVDETSLAQADLDTIDRKGRMYDIAFTAKDGAPLIISTTRPELIPGCVALFHAPGDRRYAHLEGAAARVPLFGHEVPILQSEDVDPTVGTGLMMVCTFGDGEDVKKWRLFRLDTRVVIDRRGYMTELAGAYRGLQVTQARSAIVQDLKAANLVLGEVTTDQRVSIAERSGQPIEFQMMPQWFIRLLQSKDAFAARSAELNWRPQHMKVRLDQWIEGLKFDWNISRQRFYGVPVPVWYVQETGEVIVADEQDLPVDPTEDPPPAWALKKYQGKTLVGESDVMDTWMTSSLTPLINTNWAGTAGRIGNASMRPMSVRVQAFEIIRTWLFYTVVKLHYHLDEIPWHTAMISGWGLNEQGKKISKRDLESYTDAEGYNRYDPASVISKFGADALRYWAAGARLGHDLRYNEKDVRAGRKMVVKLWNVAKLYVTYLTDFDPSLPAVPLAERPTEDRWLLSRLSRVVEQVTEAFEGYDYALGREALEKFFWTMFCDNYLEIVKDRLWRPEIYGSRARLAAQSTLDESLRVLLALIAPFMPFITDELYQRLYAGREGTRSIHVSAWPELEPGWRDPDVEEQMQPILHVLEAWRYVRTNVKFRTGSRAAEIVLDVPDSVRDALQEHLAPLRSALRCEQISFGKGEYETGRDDWRLSVVLIDLPDKTATTDD